MSWLNRIARVAGAFFLPQDCVLCGAWVCRPNWCPLCEGCQARMRPLSGPICDLCGDRVPGPVTRQLATCLRCRRKSPGFHQCRAWGAYRGPLRKLIREFKYGPHPQLAPLLGEFLYRAYRDSGVGRPDFLVGVPSHPRRIRERCLDSTSLLLRQLARQTGIPVYSKAQRARYTPPLFGLEEQDRRRNLRGVFAVQPDGELEGASILIIDDILTTGTTASELAQVFRTEARVETVNVLVVARTIRRE